MGPTAIVPYSNVSKIGRTATELGPLALVVVAVVACLSVKVGGSHACGFRPQYWTVDHDEDDNNICIEMLHPIAMHSDPDTKTRDARLVRRP